MSATAAAGSPPHCHRYPDKVRKAVEQFAKAQCSTGGFDRCVAQPLRLTLVEKEEAQQQLQTALAN